MEIVIPSCTDTKNLREAYAHDAVFESCSMETERTVTIEDIIDMREFGEIILHALYHHHRLLVAIDGESLILNAFRNNLHLWKTAHLCEGRIICCSILSLCRHHLYLWVELCEEACHHIMETIEDTKHYDQCHSGNDNSHHADERDEIDDVGALLGEEVTAGDEEGEGAPS